MQHAARVPYGSLHPSTDPDPSHSGGCLRPTLFFCFVCLFSCFPSFRWVTTKLRLPRTRYQIHAVSQFITQRSRCNSGSRCCYRAREHVDPSLSREIRCGGDSHPEMPSSSGSAGLTQTHALTKSQAVAPSRRTRSSDGPPYPLGRWSTRCNR